MAKASLIVLGLLFLIATFYVLQVAFTPADKGNIRTINSLCTAEVGVYGFTIPIGAWGSKLTGAEEQCERASQFNTLFTYGWIAYIFGGILLLAGLIIGGSQHVYHHHEPTRQASTHHKPKTNTKYCGECGEKLSGHEKHCPECGSKV